MVEFSNQEIFIVKKLKENGIVYYDGVIPGFSLEIELIKDLSF